MSLFKSLSIQARTFATKRAQSKKFTSILDNVPPRPGSAWQIFFTEQVPLFKNTNGKTNMLEAAKMVSQKWKSLPESEKGIYQQKFEERAKAHKEALEKALSNATPQQFHDENLLRKKYNLTLLKDPRKPKRPVNSFLFYLQDLRANRDPIIVNNDVKTQTIEAAKKFKQLSPSEAKVYKDKADEALKQFQSANAKYYESIQQK